MIVFEYSEFAHLIQTDFWYMAATCGAMAVLACGSLIAVAEILKPLIRKKK